MVSCEGLSLLLVIPASGLYSLAALTSSWFILPFTSYGIWSVQFCDFLENCQTFTAVASDQPDWYIVVQILTVVGWLALMSATALLLSPRLPPLGKMALNKLHTIAALCILSVFVISTSIIVFYTKLDQSSPGNPPQISWSAILAIIACILEFTAGLLLMSSDQRERGRLYI